jgi:hypothetical protein
MIRSCIRIPRDARVLLLEDDVERIRWFEQRIPRLQVVSTSLGCITAVARALKPFDLIFLDHDLELATWQADGSFDTGMHAARSIAENGYCGDQVVIHSWNPAGAANMASLFERRVHLMPFGQFEIELINDPSTTP